MDRSRASPFFGVMLNYDNPVDSSSQLPGDPRSSSIGPRTRRRGGRIYTVRTVTSARHSMSRETTTRFRAVERVDLAKIRVNTCSSLHMDAGGARIHCLMPV